MVGLREWIDLVVSASNACGVNRGAFRSRLVGFFRSVGRRTKGQDFRFCVPVSMCTGVTVQIAAVADSNFLFFTMLFHSSQYTIQ
jgi:hypothetical protein